MVEHFTVVCRLCLNEEGSFEDIFKCGDLNLWIMDFLSIVVSKDDKISLSICADCRRRLHEFHMYQLRCLEVQNVLLRKSISVEKSKEGIDQNTIGVNEEQEPTAEADAPVVKKRSRFCEQENDSGSTKVICSICNKKVFHYRLEGHQNRHQGLRPFKCERGCENLDFSCRYNRQHHYRYIHGGRQHECDVCHKTFRNKAYLYYHIKGVHAPNTFVCPVCNKGFSTSSHLIAHKTLHGAREGKYPCSLCGLSFFRKYILQTHMKAHIWNNVRGQKKNIAKAVHAVAGEDTFSEKDVEVEHETDSEPEQPNDSSEIFLMEGHQNGHQGLQSFECEIGCEDVDFDCHQMRLQHYRKVHDRHQCDVCHNIFRSRKTLNAHKRGVHGPKTFQCSACNQKFTTLERLKIHTKLVHDQEKNHACPHCSKSFCFKYKLNKHMKTHGNKVDIMEKMEKLDPGADSERFSKDISAILLETDMEAPLNSHEGLGSYKCERGCENEVFRSDQLRQNHYREVHEKYVCKICQKTFQCKPDLRSHKRSVHGTKDFTCFCGKAFTRRYTLLRHIRQVHTGEKDQCCAICSKTFVRKQDLVRHMAIHKKDDELAELEDLFEAEEVKIEIRDDDDDDNDLPTQNTTGA